jgi:uncharacterized protein (TIGR02001 family)
MKRTLLALSLLACASTIQPALADGEAAAEEEASSPWSATLTLTSDYRFRGQSQKSRDPALQGSIDFAGDSGFFVGVWASAIDFSDTLDFDSKVEIDIYAGYSFSLGENTEGSVKATYYLYPNNPFSYEYWELQGALSHTAGDVTLSAELNYSPDYFNETGTAIALAGGVEVALIENLSASGHVGHQWIDDNALFATPDFAYWDVGLTATLWGHLTLDARYVGTNLSDVECFGGTDLCEGGFVGTLSVSFP